MQNCDNEESLQNHFIKTRNRLANSIGSLLDIPNLSQNIIPLQSSTLQKQDISNGLNKRFPFVTQSSIEDDTIDVTPQNCIQECQDILIDQSLNAFSPMRNKKLENKCFPQEEQIKEAVNKVQVNFNRQTKSTSSIKYKKEYQQITQIMHPSQYKAIPVSKFSLETNRNKSSSRKQIQVQQNQSKTQQSTQKQRIESQKRKNIFSPDKNYHHQLNYSTSNHTPSHTIIWNPLLSKNNSKQNSNEKKEYFDNEISSQSNKYLGLKPTDSKYIFKGDKSSKKNSANKKDELLQEFQSIPIVNGFSITSEKNKENFGLTTSFQPNHKYNSQTSVSSQNSIVTQDTLESEKSFFGSSQKGFSKQWNNHSILFQNDTFTNPQPDKPFNILHNCFKQVKDEEQQESSQFCKQYLLHHVKNIILNYELNTSLLK